MYWGMGDRVFFLIFFFLLGKGVKPEKIILSSGKTGNLFSFVLFLLFFVFCFLFSSFPCFLW